MNNVETNIFNSVKIIDEKIYANIRLSIENTIYRRVCYTTIKHSDIVGAIDAVIYLPIQPNINNYLRDYLAGNSVG